jgi:hypothetical protein
VKPLHTIAPQSSRVNLPGRDLSPANIRAVRRVNLLDLAKILDCGLVLWDFARSHAWSRSQAKAEESAIRLLPLPNAIRGRYHRPNVAVGITAVAASAAAGSRPSRSSRTPGAEG